MGNLSFLIPTKRTEEFTVDNILTLLKTLFPKFKIFKIDGFEQIRIEDSQKNLICEIWKGNCYLLENIDDDIQSCEEEDFRNKNYYLQLKYANLNIDNCIQVSYGYTIDFSKNRTKVLKEICKEFGCYWLDEGIHPEYMKY